MRIDDAWVEWDHWCLATRNAPWRRSKHARVPDRDRQVVVDLENALRAGEAKLGASLGSLRTLITENRRAGMDVRAAVAGAVERLRRR